MAANMAEFGHLVGITESSRKFFRERLEIGSKVARQLRERGVRLVAGTESGFSIAPHGEWHSREGQLFVDLIGLSPLEALEASTQAVADAVGIGRQTGSISPGKDADVLVVEGRVDLDFNVLARNVTAASAVHSRMRSPFSSGSRSAGGFRSSAFEG